MTRGIRRFCFVTTFYPPYNFGGDGVVVRRLANELAKRDHRVDVVHCLDSFLLLNRGESPTRGYDDHPNVTVHGLKSRAGALSPLITQQTAAPGLKAKRLRRLLEAGPFDVVHYHNTSLIGAGALRYGRAIKLYTMHEHWLVCPMHVLWKYDREPCVEKRCFSCTVHGKRPPQLWRYTRRLDRLLAHVDAFIAPSLFTRDKHLEMGLRVDAPIVHIPNFLPPVRTPPMSESPPHARPYFLFVGRLERIKGANVLVRAFTRYRAADLLLAGTGGEEAALRRLARSHPHISFLGHLAYDDVQRFIRAALAVVVPSVGYEVLPTVVLEAFANRTTVIAHHLGPLPEMVEDTGGGLTYRDHTGLLAALDRIQSDATLRERLAQRAYDSYLENWTADRHVERYFALIDRLEAEKRRERSASPALVAPAGVGSRQHLP